MLSYISRLLFRFYDYTFLSNLHHIPAVFLNFPDSHSKPSTWNSRSCVTNHKQLMFLYEINEISTILLHLIMSLSPSLLNTLDPLTQIMVEYASLVGPSLSPTHSSMDLAHFLSHWMAFLSILLLFACSFNEISYYTDVHKSLRSIRDWANSTCWWNSKHVFTQTVHFKILFFLLFVCTM